MEKKSLLVVDEDNSRLENTRIFLQSKGLQVDTAGTDREIIEKTQARRYNLVLLPITFVDKEDQDFLARLRYRLTRINTVLISDDASSSNNASSSRNPETEGYSISSSNPDNLFKIIEEKLKEQDELELYRTVIPWTKR